MTYLIRYLFCFAWPGLMIDFEIFSSAWTCCLAISFSASRGVSFMLINISRALNLEGVVVDVKVGQGKRGGWRC